MQGEICKQMNRFACILNQIICEIKERRSLGVQLGHLAHPCLIRKSLFGIASQFQLGQAENIG